MTDNNDELIGGEAINAESIGLTKTSPLKKIKKQHIVMGVIVVVVIILTIVIVVLAVKNKGSQKKDDDKDSDKEHSKDDAKGIINLEYKSGSKEVQIISENYEYEKDSFDIYIGDEKKDFKKKYSFDDKNNQKVKIYVFEELNMDKMFKDIKEIISININSEKNMKIKSMESTFENCERLTTFTMAGVDTSDIKSMKNIFKNTNIKDISSAISSFGKLKNMSYMFAGTKYTSLDLSKINTEQVVSMAGLFKDSQSLRTLDLSNFDTQNVEDMSSMFEGCFSLTNII